jgi:DNA-3-methyladenine glycosylase II
MEQIGPFQLQLRPTHSTFEALLESIAYQQLNGRAARAIHDRVLDLFPERIATPEGLESLPDTAIRGAGFSAGKLASARDLAEKSLSGIVPAFSALGRMTDEEICERLTEVRGIGVWSAQMLLIFRLGRPIVLPLSDYGVRKGFAIAMGKLRPGMNIAAPDLPKAALLEKRAARWQPWCSVASWYLWRACELGRPAAANPLLTGRA